MHLGDPLARLGPALLRERAPQEPRAVGQSEHRARDDQHDRCVGADALPADETLERSFGLLQSVGDHFLGAYLPILQRRKDTPYGERERDWQLLRRGRYVEFNLVWDRGTHFGLQSGGRTESILMSMPPLVSWAYQHQPEPGSREDELLRRFLVRKDWV